MTQDSAVAEKVTQEGLRECPICGRAPMRNGRLGSGGVLCVGTTLDPVEHRVAAYGATQEAADKSWNTRADTPATIAAHTAGRLEGMREGTPEGMVLVPRELLAKFKQEAERFTAATPDAMPVEICAITQPGWQYVLTMGDIRVLATSIRALQEKHNG